MGSDPPGRPMAVPMLAGACAGVMSRLICHPIDTIKSKVQVEVAAERASWSSVIHLKTHTHTHTHTHTCSHTHTHTQVMSRTLRTQGPAGLYRGVGVAVVGGCAQIRKLLHTHTHTHTHTQTHTNTHTHTHSLPYSVLCRIMYIYQAALHMYVCVSVPYTHTHTLTNICIYRCPACCLFFTSYEVTKGVIYYCLYHNCYCLHHNYYHRRQTVIFIIIITIIMVSKHCTPTPTPTPTPTSHTNGPLTE